MKRRKKQTKWRLEVSKGSFMVQLQIINKKNNGAKFTNLFSQQNGTILNLYLHAVFGDGCGTAAGAGLIDEVVLGWARGDTAAPEFTFLPRELCRKKQKTNENHQIQYQIWFKSFAETHSPCMTFFNAVRRRFKEKTIFTKINSLIAGFISLWKFMTLIKINARAFSLVHKVARLRYSSQLYTYIYLNVYFSFYFFFFFFCKI